MGGKRKGDDKQIARLALITAILALITQIINLLARLIEWLGKP
ncbi:MAG: hypothetical protein AAGU74_14050 [Bacillota bacterium]